MHGEHFVLADNVGLGAENNLGLGAEPLVRSRDRALGLVAFPRLMEQRRGKRAG